MSLKSDPKMITIALIVFTALSVTLSASLSPHTTPSDLVGRHVDPHAESQRFPSSNFFTLLALKTFTKMLESNFSGSLEELKTLELAYIPDNLRPTIRRFTSLMKEISNRLDKADRLMDEAEILMDSEGSLSAKLLLNNASLEIALASMTYKELRVSLEELTKVFNIPRETVYPRLDDLGELIEEMSLRLLILLNKFERQMARKETFLSIITNSRTIWTGGRIMVTGGLYAPGPLPGRSVAILIDGVEVAEVLTALDGSFSALVNIPYIYKPRIFIQARYKPVGTDAEIYKPSVSDPVEVSLLYIEPRVVIEPVERVLPGKAFTVKGRVYSAIPLPHSSIKVSWIGNIIDVELLDGGKFEVMLDTPKNISDGIYELNVSLPALGIFAPASSSSNLLVERLPIHCTLNFSRFALAGFSIPLAGNFRSLDERFNARVNVYFAGREYTFSSDGGFEVKLNVPITLPSGYHVCKVRIIPDDPWYEECACNFNILIINPFIISLSLVILIVLVMKIRSEASVAINGSSENVGKVPSRTHEGELYFAEGWLRWLVDAYWRAVKIVSKITGVSMKPSMTMREFLTLVAPRLGRSRWYFSKLTSAAERALYSRKVPVWATSIVKITLGSLRDEYAQNKR
ncbi:MAG: hypothetical protein QXP84_03075 [Candidatus Korarchaeum sp.]